jgi:hypothetical protein
MLSLSILGRTSGSVLSARTVLDEADDTMEAERERWESGELRSSSSSSLMTIASRGLDMMNVEWM